MNPLPRVLVVDDSPEILLIAQNTLNGAFDVISASSLADAQEALKQVVDLLILDVNLPDGDGIDFCRKLSTSPSQRHLPVILLTSRHDAEDKLQGFSAGADDYIVKPFHPAELQARALIRVRNRANRAAPVPLQGQVTIGDLVFDPKVHKASVLVDDAPVPVSLTIQEFKLLYCLARAGGKILSREQIVEQVWDHDMRVTQRTVDTHICKLRKKISSSPSRFGVQAVYGAGYRFTENGNGMPDS